MDQVTTRQHYIWRYYLAPWTHDRSAKGKIMCCREGRIFPVTLNNTAFEYCFYEAKRLSAKELAVIRALTTGQATDVQRTIVEKWLELYGMPFAFEDEIQPIVDVFGEIAQEAADRFLTNLKITHIEEFHSMIESEVIPLLDLLRKEDIRFWGNEEQREKFSFYLCQQYFRTRRTRDSMIEALERIRSSGKGLEDIRPDRMWIPMTMIYASNVGAGVKDCFSAVLLRTDTDSFVVGDQPVVNTRADYQTPDMPEELEFFYPVTPRLGLLLTQDARYTSGEVRDIGPEEVERYNTIEFKASWDQTFAKDSASLERLIGQSSCP